MLEELGYTPTQRYASGEEIRRHLQAIADRFDLVRRRPVPHRRDPSRVGRGHRPLADPHRSRRRADLSVLRAGRGDPQPAQAAGHRRHGAVRRPRRSTRRAGTTGTPAAARANRSPSSGTRSSGWSGTGATGIQCLAPLADAAEHVYVFQRTPVGHRGARQPADRPGVRATGWSRGGSRPGWTTSRRSCWGGRSTRT